MRVSRGKSLLQGSNPARLDERPGSGRLSTASRRMSIISCPVCGQMAPDSLAACPQCGATLNGAERAAARPPLPPRLPPRPAPVAAAAPAPTAPRANPYQAPLAPLTSTFTGESAGPSQRIVAHILDVAVYAAPGFLVMHLLQSDPGASPTKYTFLIRFLLVMVMLIQLVLMATKGQSIGKAANSIKVVNVDGSDVSFPRYLFRMAIGLILLVLPVVNLVDFLFLFREDKRALHDRIAGTRVVVQPRPSLAPPAGAGVR